MKPIFAVIGGFALALGMFVGGAVFTALLLVPNSSHEAGINSDVADAWAVVPKPIDVASRELERVPDLTSEQSSLDTARSEDALEQQEPNIDTTTTSSITASAAESSEQLFLGSDEDPNQVAWAAHMDWCHDQFTSYRASDNTYQPFEGGRRECVSPHTVSSEGDTTVLAEREEIRLEFVAEGGREVEVGQWGEHVENCFSRYRSYRPEDNTYQPFGGGPRRQCE